MSNTLRQAPPWVGAYYAAWVTLALNLSREVPHALGDAASSRVLGDLAALRPVRAADVHLLLAAQIAPRLLQLAAERAAAPWRQQLGQTIDDAVVARRSGQAALWHERRREAPPPDAFAGLPWLSGELTRTAAHLAGTASACIVPVAVLLGTGCYQRAFALLCAINATVLTGLILAHVFAANGRRQEAKMAQVHRAYGKIRHAFWDNVVLGNAANRTRWQQDFVDVTGQWTAQQNLTHVARAVQVALAQLAGVAVLTLMRAGLGADFSATDAHDARRYLQLLPQVRRAASSLAAGGELYDGFRALQSYRRDYANKWSALNERASLQPASHIGSSATMREEGKLRPARDLLSLEPQARGRASVEGPNKAGKAMALVALKEALGERAVLLPAHHDLMFDTAAGSSGQRARAALLQLARDLERWPQVTHVLLDRWDGNLDGANTEHLDALIDRLATKWRVVEVRRTGPTKDAAKIGEDAGDQPCAK